MQGTERKHSYSSYVAYCLVGVTLKKKKAIAVQPKCCARIMLKMLWAKGHLTSQEKGKMGNVIRLLGDKNVFVTLKEWIR